MWPNGEEYVGQFANGRRSGFGIMAFDDGQLYEGEWRDGKRHGEGTNEWAEGQAYHGMWRYDKMHGVGTFCGEVRIDSRRLRSKHPCML